MNKLLRWFNIAVDNKDRFNEEISSFVSGIMLDIGCGQKQEILRAGVRSYIGLEYPPARKINNKLSDTDADIFGTASSLPFKDASFDSVVALHLFEHLPDPPRAAAEVWRVLKEGGFFGVTVPFMHRIHAEPCDFFRFTPHGIRAVLEEAGFSVVKTLSGGGMWKVIGARLSGYIYSDLLGLGYAVDDLKVRPKRWLLPFFIPLIAAVVLVTRILDRAHYIDKDSLGYCIIGIKSLASN
ncbi:MAG: class I SAM-dependent methyltransferase [Candidatus Omnitrophica bacterium]|nr:class I SAM-dependent methyltransferase [Candidatus Omnitrophota bacterium]